MRVDKAAVSCLLALTASSALCLLTVTKALAADVASPPPPPNSVPVEALKWLGFLFGYFLVYSIRSGNKTQDIFKSFLGILGIGVSGGAALYVSTSGLTAYASGALFGSAVYLVLALGLISLYCSHYQYDKDKPVTGWALWAETLGKVLLGEDFRPPTGSKAHQ